VEEIIFPPNCFDLDKKAMIDYPGNRIKILSLSNSPHHTTGLLKLLARTTKDPYSYLCCFFYSNLTLLFFT
jgi:hypothetical protein